MKLNKSFLLAGLWALIILVLSLLPPSSLPSIGWESIIGLDKWAHLTVYFVLGFLCAHSGRKSGISSPHWKAAILSSFYGAAMEVLQLLIYTGRNFEILDIIANIIGSCLGAFFYNQIFKKNKLWKV